MKLAITVPAVSFLFLPVSLRCHVPIDDVFCARTCANCANVTVISCSRARVCACVYYRCVNGTCSSTIWPSDSGTKLPNYLQCHVYHYHIKVSTTEGPQRTDTHSICYFAVPMPSVCECVFVCVAVVIVARVLMIDPAGCVVVWLPCICAAGARFNASNARLCLYSNFLPSDCEHKQTKCKPQPL